MKIGAAQVRSLPGNVGANVVRHLELAALAASRGADLVFFPELSLTGYAPRLAQSLAMPLADPRLDVFQEFSDAQRIIIGLGLPLVAASGPSIGMAWFAPGKPRRSYAKQILHADELPYFVGGEQQLVLVERDHRLVPAICYESLQPEHARAAAQLEADVYLASVAKPAQAMASAWQHYPAIARRHTMYVIAADAVGPCEGFVSVGQSAAWGRDGKRLAQLDRASEGLVLLDTAGGHAEPVLVSVADNAGAPRGPA